MLSRPCIFGCACMVRLVEGISVCHVHLHVNVSTQCLLHYAELVSSMMKCWSHNKQCHSLDSSCLRLLYRGFLILV